MCFQYKMNERRRRNDASQQKWQTHTCIHTKQTHTHSRCECLTSALSIQPKHEWQWNTDECSRRWSLKLAFLPAVDWVSHSAKQERRPRDRISQRASVRARVHVPSHIHLCYNARSIWKEIWYLLARLDWCTEAVSCSTRRDVFPAS